MENGFIFFITRGMVIFAHHVPSAEMCVNNIVWLVHDFHKLCSTKLLLEMTFKPKKDLLCVVGCGTHYFLGFFLSFIHATRNVHLPYASTVKLCSTQLDWTLVCCVAVWYGPWDQCKHYTVWPCNVLTILHWVYAGLIGYISYVHQQFQNWSILGLWWIQICMWLVPQHKLFSK